MGHLSTVNADINTKIRNMNLWTLTCWALLMEVTLFSCCTKGRDSADVNFPGQIRGGYMGSWNIDVLPEMARRGMNVALVKFGEVRVPVSSEQLNLLTKWSEACRENSLKFIPVINLWGRTERTWVHPQSNFYPRKKHRSGWLPCPLDEQVHKRVINDRIVELARLSNKLDIAGVVIDLEMYGGEVKYFPEACLCDHCFDKFIEEHKSSKPVAAGMRKSHLIFSHQLNSYRTSQEEHIAELARQTKEKIESIAPDFVLGAFHLDRPWVFNKGLLKGWGSRGFPVLVFTEMTYSKGYNPYIFQTLENFNKNKLNAKLVVGIWQNKFAAEELSAQYYYCAKAASGYWIYTMQSLSAIGKKSPSLRYSKDEYWRAIGTANHELSKLAADPNYKTHLRLDNFKPVK